MQKKLGSLLLVIILFVSLLSGCNTTMKFQDVGDMQSYVDGVWESEHITYAICNGEIVSFSENTLDYIWSEFSSSAHDFNNFTAQKFYNEIYLSHNLVESSDFSYDYENGKLVSGSIEWLEFSNDEKAINNDEVFRKVSDSLTYVEDKVKNYFDIKIEDVKFNAKYSNLPSAKEVQYNKWGHFGDNFVITGIAELDDYYNWGYANYEYGYFCINIRPTGGSYSDEWYVYANRNSFSDLYASLQSGSKNVTLVAQMVYVDTGSNNMATLVDYKG